MFYRVEASHKCYETRTSRYHTSNNRDGWVAQNRPSLTWEGDVQGTALLIIQGDRVTVDTRSTGSVARSSFRFRESLDARERIDVESRSGAARVGSGATDARQQLTGVVEVASRGRNMQPRDLDFTSTTGAVAPSRATRMCIGITAGMV